jgi:hypothetical protein
MKHVYHVYKNVPPPPPRIFASIYPPNNKLVEPGGGGGGGATKSTLSTSTNDLKLVHTSHQPISELTYFGKKTCLINVYIACSKSRQSLLLKLT